MTAGLERRDAAEAERLAAAIRAVARRPRTLMEVCGGQTHAIVRYGIDQLLPPEVTLVHGPGCPVCVTPPEAIDRAIALARDSRVVLCTFGDMMRVPGSRTSLMQAKARGGDVRVVYAPTDVLDVARAEPEREVVLFAVGFETTTPATALAVRLAEQEGIANFSILPCHVLVPPAMAAILAAADNRVEGFLAAGHVCTVTGYAAYRDLGRRFGVPIVVTGFEPIDILEGVLICLRMLEDGRIGVENQYSRVVAEHGNLAARTLVDSVYRVADRSWRGIGPLPESGLALRPELAHRDAALRFPDLAPDEPAAADERCIAGLVLRGARRPTDCVAFGTACTPERPLGAPMVSSEGACAAYFRHRAPAASP